MSSYSNYQGIAGFNYPSYGKKIFEEDFVAEQDAISKEIIDRFVETFGKGIISGGNVTISATANSIDIDRTVFIDDLGRCVIVPAQTALLLAEGLNTIILRHKWVTTEYTRPNSGGQTSNVRTNGFELIARTSSPESDDALLFEVNLTGSTVTIGSDLRTICVVKSENLDPAVKNYTDTELNNSNIENTLKLRGLEVQTPWNLSSAPEANEWRTIAFGNDIFIAISGTGTNRIMRSVDFGKTWSAISAPEANTWSGVAFGNDVFIAVSLDGTNKAMKSTDGGLNWVSILTFSTTNKYAIAFANGVFIAVGATAGKHVTRSTDNGLTWTDIGLTTAVQWECVATDGNGRWIMGGGASGGPINAAYSTDEGLTWTLVTPPYQHNWRSVVFSNGVAIALVNTRVFHSLNGGMTWVESPIPEENNWESMIYGNGVVVAVASSGANRVMRSVDNGLTWSSMLTPEANSWKAITFGNNKFVAVATVGTNRIMRKLLTI